MRTLEIVYVTYAHALQYVYIAERQGTEATQSTITVRSVLERVDVSTSSASAARQYML